MDTTLPDVESGSFFGRRGHAPACVGRNARCTCRSGTARIVDARQRTRLAFFRLSAGLPARRRADGGAGRRRARTWWLSKYSNERNARASADGAAGRAGASEVQREDVVAHLADRAGLRDRVVGSSAAALVGDRAGPATHARWRAGAWRQALPTSGGGNRPNLRRSSRATNRLRTSSTRRATAGRAGDGVAFA